MRPTARGLLFPSHHDQRRFLRSLAGRAACLSSCIWLALRFSLRHSRQRYLWEVALSKEGIQQRTPHDANHLTVCWVHHLLSRGSYPPTGCQRETRLFDSVTLSGYPEASHFFWYLLGRSQASLEALVVVSQRTVVLQGHKMPGYCPYPAASYLPGLDGLSSISLPKGLLSPGYPSGDVSRSLLNIYTGCLQ